jgi:23S rRNA (cytosine1962-C5)-methyltransferase
MPRRLGFFEAEQMAKEQIGIVYIAPPRPTGADDPRISREENYQRWRLWQQYEEKMQLVNALCMTMAEVYTMADGRLIRVDGEEIEAVYERNDASVRTLEGLETSCGFFEGEGLRTDLDGVCEIVENGIRYRVDYRSGQKTGFFLDQKYNRQAVARLAPGKRVLDCFTHTGAFALNAAAGGAESVCAVDVSADALALAREHAVMNGLEGKMSFLCADVFELLDELLAKGGKPYDFIILDPPAFTKSNATLHNAIKGYREINRKAMQLLPRGGYLATCSCSHFMRDTYFRQMLHDASAEAGVTLRQIEGRQQSPDHPILWNVPETDYLKFYLFQVV